ncbi:3-phosphoshikimate 1-carboxyvinyltransferase [Pelagibacterales bacterium SAG-MED31]|nr:3-phosphoshikimate 1-carboxyvinyltransferase [Pelagibacterales bacterium SAG-MED31]
MFSEQTNTGINGIVTVPGDKSISHRSIIIPSISRGICEVSNILKSDDVLNTMNAFKEMGVEIKEENKKIIINGKGLESLKMPNKELYLGNSGTSARLLTGLLASQNFDTVLTGDKSLSSRPMKRITNPLSEMGAEIKTHDGKLPLHIHGKSLKNCQIQIEIPSAQIKSGLILAALNTEGTSCINEHHITRNHTEIMLETFGADIQTKKFDNSSKIIINGKKDLTPKNIDVPADLSSSAFFIVAALINKNSDITLENININPTRNGLLIALKKMGANIKILNKRTRAGEIVADINVKSSELNGCELDKEMAKLMIDEFPILSVAASQANSPSQFKGLDELRIKESDRLELIHLNLNTCGCYSEIKDNNIFINPTKNTEIINPEIRTDYDHRIAMSFAILGSKIGKLHINESESINTSFPTFKNQFNKAGGKLY